MLAKKEFCLACQTEVETIEKLYQSVMGTEGCTWSEEYPTHEITLDDYERRSLFCLKQEEEIIGAISIDEDPVVKELSCWNSKLQPSAELSRLVVKKEYQNQGYARELLTNGMEELRKRGMKSVHFLVSKTNYKAINSYDKLNFSVVGETDLFGEHWWCYEKAL